MCKKLLNSFKNSLNGITLAFKSDLSVRIEFVVIVCLIITLIFLDVSWIRKTSMATSLLLVLSIELINTAIEKLADRFVPEYDIQIKFVKDVASAAVFLAILAAALIWVGCIFCK